MPPDRCTCRFGSVLGLSVLELTGDVEPEAGQLDSADLLCTTPEKLDALSRKLGEKGGMRFFGEVGSMCSPPLHRRCWHMPAHQQRRP